jgi:hypothetical protein
MFWFVLSIKMQFYFKGPALVVFNNGVFTEDDWRNIQKLGNSYKKSDPLKVKLQYNTFRTNL